MRLLRPLAYAVGLVAALGVLAGRRTARRYVASIEREPAATPEPVVAPSTTRRQRVARRVVGTVGVALLVVGLWKLVHVVLPASYGWLVVWLVGAVVLHDAVIAPVLVGLRAAAHRGLGRLPAAALGVVKGAAVGCGLLVLVVAPMLWAQHLGPANPTVLPGAYGRRLLVAVVLTAVVLAAAVLAAAVAAAVVARGERPEDDQPPLA